MRTSDFDYELPAGQIAQTPAEPRDSARLMVLRRDDETIEHRVFRELPGLLKPGDLLVMNDTRVMAARLRGRRTDTGGKVEALLTQELPGGDWEALLRPAKAAIPGRRFRFDAHGTGLEATAVERTGDTVRLHFDEPFDPATVGEVPLPPYIRGYRGDPERYQTVYSREARSAAAPTAGLHFTPELLEAVDAAGIERATVTLHVGPGTFKPVQVDDPREHQLHAEHVEVTSEDAGVIQGAVDAGRRVVAVGTTVVRTLEHVSRERDRVEAYSGWTALRILPGDEFRVVGGMVTNFHLPRSTLLMLVAAFAGREFVLQAYREAVDRGYRFYSFGDAMLVL